MLARSPEGSFQFDGNGRLHLVYTEKNAEGTSLGNPGEMRYRYYHDDQWTGELDIRSDAGEGIPFCNGGANRRCGRKTMERFTSFFTITATAPASSGTNQVEVYYRKLLPSGDFESDEIRITDNEKNSWRPKIALNRDGQIALVWYDFSLNSLGDLGIALSDANQQFSSTDFAEQVVADANPNGEGVQMTNAVFDTTGRLHVTWTAAELEGFSYVNERLFYGVLDDPASRTLSQRIEVSSRGTLSTDPAKIKVADETAWIAWTDMKTQIPNIFLTSKAYGDAEFGEAIQISENDYPEENRIGQFGRGAQRERIRRVDRLPHRRRRHLSAGLRSGDANAFGHHPTYDGRIERRRTAGNRN